MEKSTTYREPSIEGERGSATARGRSSTTADETISTMNHSTMTYPRIPQIHLHHTTNLRVDRTNPRASSSRGRGSQRRAPTTHVPATKRTRRERRDTSRTLGRGRRSCMVHQNVSGNGWSEGEKKTHPCRFQRLQTSRTAKRPYQAMSRETRNILQESGTSASPKRTRYVEIPGQEDTRSCRRR